MRWSKKEWPRTASTAHTWEGIAVKYVKLSPSLPRSLPPSSVIRYRQSTSPPPPPLSDACDSGPGRSCRGRSWVVSSEFRIHRRAFMRVFSLFFFRALSRSLSRSRSRSLPLSYTVILGLSARSNACKILRKYEYTCCTHTYIHTYIHACMHACMHMYIHIYIYMHTYIYTYIHTYIYIHVHIYIYIHTCTHVYIHIYYIHTCKQACTCTCMKIYTYMYIHIHTYTYIQTYS